MPVYTPAPCTGTRPGSGKPLVGAAYLSVRQVVNGDGQEDVEKGVVAEQGQDDEVERVNHSGSMAPLGLDALVHHLVPVFAGEDLFQKNNGTSVKNYSGWFVVGIQLLFLLKL